MPVVTIRGQLGSGSPEIGRIIARRLNVDYVDREIIADVAAQLQRPKEDVATKETPPGTLLGRIVESLSRGYTIGGGGYEGVYLPAWEIPLDDTRYMGGLESVIKDLAASRSIVIRGRGSQFILKNYPDTFHVLTVSPLDLRVQRVMSDLKTDEESARKEILRFDTSHREFIKRYFNSELGNPVNYDMVINTGNLSFEDCASIIISAIPLKKTA